MSHRAPGSTFSPSRSDLLSDSPAHRAPMTSSSSSNDAASILSASSIADLRDALSEHLKTQSEPAGVRITAALATICAEARREQIPAERLLVAFKGIWTSLPEVRRLPPDRAADEMRDLVTLCIERYYAPV